ncbi:MAG: hypothetical protein IJ244_01195 [Bacteroidaceae bacterium]|nr:hypothetical protein [Bacteroidaceae bacterium]
MNRIKLLLSVSLVLALAFGCKPKADPEVGGRLLLSQARAALNINDYTQAKQCIEQLRKDFPLALNAREEAILLLDSVNLAEAHVELQLWEEKLQQPGLSRIDVDTLDFNRDEAQQKVRFFEKKIEVDKGKLRKH